MPLTRCNLFRFELTQPIKREDVLQLETVTFASETSISDLLHYFIKRREDITEEKLNVLFHWTMVARPGDTLNLLNRFYVVRRL